MREQPRAYGKLLSAAVALVACSALAAPAGEAQDATRAALKAGYLLNFIKFVEWPSRTLGDTVTVCFLGNSGIYDEFSSGLPDKRLGTRRLVARRLAPAEAV